MKMAKNRRRKNQRYYPPKNRGGDIIVVSHGRTTHTLREAERCAFCSKVRTEFAKIASSGNINV